MSGVLIYTNKEAKRNRFSIEKFIQKLDVTLVDENYRGDADFVINRTNDYKIAEYYESRGIRVFNPSSLSKIANDKQKCYEFMKENGIEIMPINYKGVPAVKKLTVTAVLTYICLTRQSRLMTATFIKSRATRSAEMSECG